MDPDYLYFKRKIVSGEDLELVFHKGNPSPYEQEGHPVVRFVLKNCENLAEVDFGDLNDDDGCSSVEIKRLENRAVVEVVNFSDVVTTFICESVKRQEAEYSSEDVRDFVNDYNRRWDEERSNVNSLENRIENLNQYLTHELDIAERKLAQAFWIGEEKKMFYGRRSQRLKSSPTFLTESDSGRTKIFPRRCIGDLSIAMTRKARHNKMQQ